jgi:hypothetical protein
MCGKFYDIEKNTRSIIVNFFDLAIRKQFGET